MKKHFLTKIFIVGGILALGTFVYLNNEYLEPNSNNVKSKSDKLIQRQIARGLGQNEEIKINIPNKNPTRERVIYAS